MPRRVTIKDLARELGLSVPAVSLALRNAGNVSKKTCERVQAAAKKLDYRPNPYAAALSTGRTMVKTDGMPVAIVRWLARTGMYYPTSAFTDAIEERCLELGYSFERCHIESPAELPKTLRVLYNRGFQGIFLAPFEADLRRIKVDWSRFSVLTCGRYEHASDFHSVRYEIFESTRLVMSEAIRRGYRRIGAALLLHDPVIQDDFARSGAILQAQQELRKVDRIPILFTRPDESSKVVPWVRKYKPDAVVGFSVGHYFDLLQAGLRIPEDIAFATLHCVRGEYYSNITGMIEREHQLGVAAANQMNSMIRHHEKGIPPVPQETVIRSEWLEGTTLPFRSKI